MANQKKKIKKQKGLTRRQLLKYAGSALAYTMGLILSVILDLPSGAMIVVTMAMLTILMVKLLRR